MRNWVIATIVAATVGGGGAVYYVVSDSPPPAVQSVTAAAEKEATPTAAAPQARPSETTAPAVQSAALPPAAAPAAATSLRFRITVSRTDKPGLDTAWTAVCPREDLRNRVNGCRVDDRKGMVDGASAIAVFDDGDGRLGFVRDLSMAGTGLSRGTGVALPQGTDYPMLGRGGPNSRWAIPVADWKRGVDFQLYVSRMNNVGMTIKRTSENVGRATIVLLD